MSIKPGLSAENSDENGSSSRRCKRNCSFVLTYTVNSQHSHRHEVELQLVAAKRGIDRLVRDRYARPQPANVVNPTLRCFFWWLFIDLWLVGYSMSTLVGERSEAWLSQVRLRDDGRGKTCNRTFEGNWNVLQWFKLSVGVRARKGTYFSMLENSSNPRHFWAILPPCMNMLLNFTQYSTSETVIFALYLDALVYMLGFKWPLFPFSSKFSSFNPFYNDLRTLCLVRRSLLTTLQSSLLSVLS